MTGAGHRRLRWQREAQCLQIWSTGATQHSLNGQQRDQLACAAACAARSGRRHGLARNSGVHCRVWAAAPTSSAAAAGGSNTAKCAPRLAGPCPASQPDASAAVRAGWLQGAPRLGDCSRGVGRHGSAGCTGSAGCNTCIQLPAAPQQAAVLQRQECEGRQQRAAAVVIQCSIEHVSPDQRIRQCQAAEVHQRAQGFEGPSPQIVCIPQDQLSQLGQACTNGGGTHWSGGMDLGGSSRVQRSVPSRGAPT